jgi:small conductance mechanosensitive channel
MNFLENKWLQAIVILLIGWIAGPLVKRLFLKLGKAIPEQGAMTFIGSSLSIIIRIIGTVMALSSLGVNTNVIVGALSAAGLGISLALKENMANVAGGIQILLTKPFSIGDYIQIGEYEGACTRLEVMFTTLLTFDRQEVVIPNAMIISSIVVNYSKEKNRRIHIQMPISHSTDLPRCMHTFEQIIRHQPEILKNEESIQVTVDDFKERYVVLGIYCYVPYETYWPTLFALQEQLQQARKEVADVPEYSIHATSDK